MREALSKCLSSSLVWDDSDHEKAVDKLTAFAYSERFATLLWRLKYANDHTVYWQVIEILVAIVIKTTRRIGRMIATKIAEQAIHEWLFAFCPSCLGAKETMAGHLKIICPVCNGSGVARFSDQNRRVRMGGDYTKPLATLHRVISANDIKPAVEMRQRLARG